MSHWIHDHSPFHRATRRRFLLGINFVYYIIYLETENKTVHLGNGDDLNTRMLWLKSIIEQTKDKKGIIFLDMDLNVKKPYFRQEG